MAYPYQPDVPWPLLPSTSPFGPESRSGAA